ncbi:MAG: Uma2 family endonuclease [Chloracidobacterium sp.]
MSLAYILQELDDPDFDDIHGDDETGGFAADKALRLLVSSLYASWRPSAVTFLAAARVAVRCGERLSQVTTVVPDVLVAAGVTPSAEWWKPSHRVYLVSRFGKPPDVAIDLLTRAAERPETPVARQQAYEQMGVTYWVVYDPCRLRSAQPVTVFERNGQRLTPRADTQLPRLGLGLTLWRGTFEQRDDEWLRWNDLSGNLLLTGDELATYWRCRATELQAQVQASSVQAPPAKPNH